MLGVIQNIFGVNIGNDLTGLATMCVCSCVHVILGNSKILWYYLLRAFIILLLIINACLMQLDVCIHVFCMKLL